MAEIKKFSPMRWTAATEEAAVAGALQIVGVTAADIEYEVLDQSAKGVTVRIKPRSAEPAPQAPLAPAAEAQAVEATPVDTTAVEAEPAAEPQEEIYAASEAEDYESDEAEAGEEEDEEYDSEDEDGDEYEEDDEDDSDEEEDADEDDSDEEDADDDSDDDEAETDGVAASSGAEPVAAEPEVGPLDPEVAEQARALAQEFLDRMGLEANAILADGGNAASVPLAVEGNDVGILIGKHGQTLQAFQYLLNLTLNNSAEPDGGVRVVVDAGNYRARRQSSLEQTARAAAARARREGRSIRMEPMPAHERRLIHMFLQSDTEVTTASDGREPMRRVIVTPSGMTPRTGRDRGYGERSYGGYGERGGDRSDRGGDRGGERSGGRRGMGSYGGNRGNGRGYGR